MTIEVRRDRFNNISEEGGVKFEVDKDDKPIEKKIKEVFNALSNEFIWLSKND